MADIISLLPDHVANQIAAVAKEGDYDLILMGRESIDFNGGMVHGMEVQWPGVMMKLKTKK